VERLGIVMSVNVGRPRTVRWFDRDVTSAIWKSPVAGPVRVEGVNLDGDDQADRRVHGGPTKSVYAYAVADADWWAEQLDVPIGPGTFGENLTVDGPDPARAVVGERWQIGNVVLRVTEPRIPCFKLGMRMGSAEFVDRFARAARAGTYFAIEAAGSITPGDPIDLVDRPDHGLTVGAVERTYHGAEDHVEAMLTCTDLSEGWREWAARYRARVRRETEGGRT
jgi:MOSC domain-containing protein YiiM